MIEIKIGRTAIIVLALLILLQLWDRPDTPDREGVEPEYPPPYFPDDIDPDEPVDPRQRQFFADHRN